MKIKSLKQYSDVVIDYQNGIECEFTTYDNEVIRYRFYNEQYRHLQYLTKDEVEYVKKTHWSNVRLKENIKLSIEDIENFTDFDSLYYFGGGIDGMFRKHTGEPISTPIILDDIFCKIYLDIETKESECLEILNKLNDNYILNKKVVNIPYYNQDEDKEYHSTIYLEILFPDDIYSGLLKDEKYVDDEVRKNVYKKLKL